MNGYGGGGGGGEGSGSIHASSPPPSDEAGDLVKISQRPSRSCTECIRRKTRCNKQIPCDLCMKRGVSHLCRLESQYAAGPSGSTLGIGTGTSAPPPFLPPSTFPTNLFPSPVDLDLLRQSVFAEIDSLRKRVFELEKAATRQGAPAAASGGDGAAGLRASVPPLEDRKGRAGSSIKGEEQVEPGDAATTLEFLALGLDRRLGVSGGRPGTEGGGEGDSRVASPEPAQPPHPTPHILPDPAPDRTLPDSIVEALLPRPNVTAILTFAEQSVLWQHCCVFFPTFWREVDAFWHAIGSPATGGWTRVEPTWISLLYTLMGIAIHQMTDEDAGKCGLAEADRLVLPNALVSAAEDALYAGQFLSRPTIWTVQAIAILTLCGHNVCESDLLSSLLAVGIKTAQAMNLHSLGKASQALTETAQAGSIGTAEAVGPPSTGGQAKQPSLGGRPGTGIVGLYHGGLPSHGELDGRIPLAAGMPGPASHLALPAHASHAKSMRPPPPQRTSSVRMRKIVEVELGKRLWWSLTQEDWFAIPFRGVWSIHPEHFDSPLPNNCSDQDLAEGNYINRPDGVLTVAFKQRFSSQVASILQNVFHRLASAQSAFAIAEEAANRVRQLIKSLPAPLQAGTSPSTSGIPPYTQAMRHYLQISATHKILVVYRAILARGGTQRERAKAHAACVEAAERIIDELERGSRQRETIQALWTIPYHSLAAAVVLAMDMISLGQKPEAAARKESVMRARTALERLAPTSRIARRGLQVLADLFREAEEMAKGKRRRSSDAMAKMVKKIKLPVNEMIESSTPSPSAMTSISPTTAKFNFNTANAADTSYPTVPTTHYDINTHTLSQPGSAPVSATSTNPISSPTTAFVNVVPSPDPVWNMFDFSEEETNQLLMSLQGTEPDLTRLFDGSIGTFGWTV